MELGAEAGFAVSELLTFAWIWKKYCPNLLLIEKFHVLIQRKLDLTLEMSLPMFYETVRQLLPLATAADLFVQQTRFFLSDFALCQLTLEPDFFLVYVLQMNFAVSFLFLLLSLGKHLISPFLDYRHLMRL